MAHPQLSNHILARQKTKRIVMFGMCAEENNQKQSRVSAEESWSVAATHANMNCPLILMNKHIAIQYSSSGLLQRSEVVESFIKSAAEYDNER